jgi:hypothetical protein
LGNADTVSILTQQITQTFAWGDSAAYAQQGLPTHLSQVRLVSDSSLCARALQALYANAKDPHPPEGAGAYVFALDTVAFAVIAADDVNMYRYFDRGWHWLAGLVALD